MFHCTRTLHWHCRRRAGAGDAGRLTRRRHSHHLTSTHSRRRGCWHVRQQHLSSVQQLTGHLPSQQHHTAHLINTAHLIHARTVAGDYTTGSHQQAAVQSSAPLNHETVPSIVTLINAMSQPRFSSRLPLKPYCVYTAPLSTIKFHELPILRSANRDLCIINNSCSCLLQTHSSPLQTFHRDQQTTFADRQTNRQTNRETVSSAQSSSAENSVEHILLLTTLLVLTKR